MRLLFLSKWADFIETGFKMSIRRGFTSAFPVV
jgi:hypothetical protein